MQRMNVWDEAEILPMAIRLRKSGKCQEEIDNLYGQVIVEIVLMATRMLPEKDRRYRMHSRKFMEEDVQGLMVFNALNAAEKFVDSRKNPRSIVNYLVKTVQNRLRNLVRDTENREQKMDIVTECELQFDMMSTVKQACDIEGRKFWEFNSCASKKAAKEIK